MQFLKITCLGIKIIWKKEVADQAIEKLNKTPISEAKYTETSVGLWIKKMINEYYPTSTHFRNVDIHNMSYLRGLYPNVRKILSRRFFQEYYYDDDLSAPTEILTLDELEQLFEFLVNPPKPLEIIGDSKIPTIEEYELQFNDTFKLYIKTGGYLPFDKEEFIRVTHHPNRLEWILDNEEKADFT